MPSLTVTSLFDGNQYNYFFSNTPDDLELQSISNKVLGGLSLYLNRPELFGRFVKILLIDGPNVGIQNQSFRDRYQRAIAWEESRGYIVVPIIVVNDMNASFITFNETTTYIVVSDPSKTIDDAVIGNILETIGMNRNTSFFQRLVAVTICSSDFKLVNTPDDKECMSAQGSCFGPTNRQARQSIFNGAVFLKANAGPNLIISFLIPDTHQNRIPLPDYGSVAHPRELLDLQMMDVDHKYGEQLNRQRRVDKSIRDLFIGMFAQEVIHPDGSVSVFRSTHSANQYAHALKPVGSDLLKLAAMIQPVR